MSGPKPEALPLGDAPNVCYHQSITKSKKKVNLSSDDCLFSVVQTKKKN